MAKKRQFKQFVEDIIKLDKENDISSVAAAHKIYPFSLEQNRALEGIWGDEMLNMKLRYASCRFKNLFSASSNQFPFKSDQRFSTIELKKLELFVLGHESADYFQHLGLTFLTIQQAMQFEYNLFVEVCGGGCVIIYDRNMNIVAYAKQTRTNENSLHFAAACKCGNVCVKYLVSNHLRVMHNEKELYFGEQAVNKNVNYKAKYIAHIDDKCKHLNQDLTCEEQLSFEYKRLADNIDLVNKNGKKSSR